MRIIQRKDIMDHAYQKPRLKFPIVFRLLAANAQRETLHSTTIQFSHSKKESWQALRVYQIHLIWLWRNILLCTLLHFLQWKCHSGSSPKKDCFTECVDLRESLLVASWILVEGRRTRRGAFVSMTNSSSREGSLSSCKDSDEPTASKHISACELFQGSPWPVPEQGSGTRS